MTDASTNRVDWPSKRSSVALLLVNGILRNRLVQLDGIIIELAARDDHVRKVELLASGEAIFKSVRRWLSFNIFSLIAFDIGAATLMSRFLPTEFLRTLLTNWSAIGMYIWADAAMKQPRNKFEMDRYKLWKLVGVESIPFIIEALPKNLKKEHLESAPLRVELLATLLSSPEYKDSLSELQWTKLDRYCESPDPTRHDQELMRESIRKLKAALKMCPKAGVQT